MAHFIDILLQSGIIGAEQIKHARRMARACNMKMGEALVRLGYASGEDVMRAIAEEYHIDYVNVEEVVVPACVIQLVPESFARENVILPISVEDCALTVVTSNPLDLDIFDELRFILNRKIQIALAPPDAIIKAINRHYVQCELESAALIRQPFSGTGHDRLQPSFPDGTDIDADTHQHTFSYSLGFKCGVFFARHRCLVLLGISAIGLALFGLLSSLTINWEEVLEWVLFALLVLWAFPFLKGLAKELTK